jgi:hypothetical protein
MPDTESQQKLENNSATVTPVTDTNVIKSVTYEWGGVQNPSDDDEKNPTEKLPVSVLKSKGGGILFN